MVCPISGSALQAHPPAPSTEAKFQVAFETNSSEMWAWMEKTFANRLSPSLLLFLPSGATSRFRSSERLREFVGADFLEVALCLVKLTLQHLAYWWNVQFAGCILCVL